MAYRKHCPIFWLMSKRQWSRSCNTICTDISYRGKQLMWLFSRWVVSLINEKRWRNQLLSKSIFIQLSEYWIFKWHFKRNYFKATSFSETIYFSGRQYHCHTHSQFLFFVSSKFYFPKFTFWYYHSVTLKVNKNTTNHNKTIVCCRYTIYIIIDQNNSFSV